LLKRDSRELVTMFGPLPWPTLDFTDPLNAEHFGFAVQDIIALLRRHFEPYQHFQDLSSKRSGGPEADTAVLQS
jgi:hypothetical protein